MDWQGSLKRPEWLASSASPQRGISSRSQYQFLGGGRPANLGTFTPPGRRRAVNIHCCKPTPPKLLPPSLFTITIDACVTAFYTTALRLHPCVPPHFCCSLLIVLGSATYGAQGGSTQGTLEEVTSAKDYGKALLVIKMCDKYVNLEVSE